MNIALCHFRVGETDGVSLEMDKWKSCLELLGHEMFYIAGSKGSSQCHTIDEMHYKNAVNDKIVRNAFVKFEDYNNIGEFISEVETIAKRVEQAFISFFNDYKIDVVVPNNIFSLGWNIPVAIGLYNAIVATNTRCVCHHHDFYWERKKYSQPTIGYIDKALKKYFPPKHDLFKHVVINQLAKKELKKRRGLESTVIPNVFDFEHHKWVKDDYNQDFRQTIGIKKDDFLVLQATRIVPRKGIELAIDFVAELNKPENRFRLTKNRFQNKEFKIYLVLAGLNENRDYYEKLKEYAQDRAVDLLNINLIINHSRGIIKGVKKYSLWDAYVHCDLITYPSLLEGWGNQFIEGINARKLMVVFEYPVFESDIKPFKFNYISLGNQSHRNINGLVEIPETKLKQAVKKTIEIRAKKNEMNRLLEDNYRIGIQNLSYASLTNLLKSTFS